VQQLALRLAPPRTAAHQGLLLPLLLLPLLLQLQLLPLLLLLLLPLLLLLRLCVPLHAAPR
jgi:hypothetical protein